MDASSDLWKAESIFYPPAIHETAQSSSEAVRDPEEASAAQSEAVEIIVPSGESSDREEPPDTARAPEDLNSEAPKEGAEPTASAQIPSTEEPVILAQPLQAIPLAKVPKSPDTDPAQPLPEGTVPQGIEESSVLPSPDVADTGLKE